MPDQRICWAVREMERQLATVEVAALAAAVNLSPSRFAHLFRRDAGLSPARYLHMLRMERARRLFERTFLTVRQVMAEVGIADPSHFTRDFRRYHGMTPGAARRTPRPEDMTSFLAAHHRLAAEGAAPAHGAAAE